MPEWAGWSPAAAERPWTVGLEEEVLLLEQLDGTPANRIDDVLAALPPALVLMACAPVAAALDCEDELAAAAELAVAPGDARRRAWARLDGADALPARLAERFAPAGDAVVA